MIGTPLRLGNGMTLGVVHGSLSPTQSAILIGLADLEPKSLLD